MKTKKERIQFEDGEKIEFPTVEEKRIVEGIILPKNLFSSNNELIRLDRLKDSKVTSKKEKQEKVKAKDKKKAILKKPVKTKKTEKTKMKIAVVKKKAKAKQAKPKKPVKKSVPKAKPAKSKSSKPLAKNKKGFLNMFKAKKR